jgi:uncharacterized membrane protein
VTTSAPLLQPGPSERRPRRSDWWVPLPLVLLGLIPTIFGTLRLVEIFGGPHVMPANPRISASPSPAVVHIIGGTVFLLVGAFQLSRRIRNRWRSWHRRAGRVLMILGLAAALAGFWMTLFYPRQTGTGAILRTSRVLFAVAMAVSLVLGFRAIRRRDLERHRAWMMRAYALGLGAGTQAITIGLGQGIFGKTVLTTDLSTAAGWIVNISVAEYLIRRPHRRRARRRSAARTASRPLRASI